MKSNERIFRYPYRRFLLLYFSLLSFLGFGLGIISLVRIDIIFLFMAVGIGLILTISYFTSGAKISDEGIFTGSPLGSNSIKWSEIVHVSICGYHNLRQSNLIGSFSNNGNSLMLQGVNKNIKLIVTTDPSEYSRLVSILFKKRPDLFETDKGYIIDFLTTKSTMADKLFWELLFIASSVFIIYQTGFQMAAWIVGIFLAINFFFSILNSLVTDPLSIILENNTLRLIYLSNRTITFPVNEIISIRLEKVWEMKSRILYSTFLYEGLPNKKPPKFISYHTYHNVHINMKGKEPVILKWSGHLVYVILKNWHKKNVVNELSTGRF